MQVADEPTKIPIPFAFSGPRNVIPNTSLIGTTPGAASFPDGFPPLTATLPAAGGLGPTVEDLNGIGFQLSAPLRWASAGGHSTFDAAFSSAVNGYPNGAVLLSSDRVGLWLSTANNNTANPDAGGANWVPLVFVGSSAQAVSNVNVTLTNVQASRSIIVLTGVLTGPVSVVFPAWTAQWLIINQTSGPFVVAVKTSTGIGSPLSQGSNYIYGDGANVINSKLVSLSNFSYASTSAGWWRKSPDGFIEQGGVVLPSNTGNKTFPIPFPTQCLSFIVGNTDVQGNSNDVSYGYAVNTSTFFVATKGTPGNISGFGVAWLAKGI